MGGTGFSSLRPPTGGIDIRSSAALPVCWMSAIAGTLRAHTLHGGLQHLSRALHLLIATDFVNIHFLAGDDSVIASYGSSGTKGNDTDDLPAHSDRKPSLMGPTIFSQPIVRSCCDPDTNIMVRLDAGWETRPHDLETAAWQLSGAIPLLSIAAERLWTIAPCRRSTLSNAPADVIPPLEFGYARMGAHVLSPRERQTLTALLSGLSPKSIAREFGIATGTVRNHMRHIYSKLNVTSRSQLLSLFIRAVIADPESSLVEDTRGRVDSSQRRRSLACNQQGKSVNYGLGEGYTVIAATAR